MDGRGRALVLIVSPGQAGDSPVLPKLLGELRPAMLEVASGEDDDASALRRLTAVPRRRVPVVDRAVSAMLSKVRGEPARALARVLEAHGRAQWALAGLSSHSAVRRAHAALSLSPLPHLAVRPRRPPSPRALTSPHHLFSSPPLCSSNSG